MSNLRKRSVLLSGHATSVALEAEFWRLLDDLAVRRGGSLAGLLAAIDQGRGRRPLASACRLTALDHAVATARENAPDDAVRGAVPSSDVV